MISFHEIVNHSININNELPVKVNSCFKFHCRTVFGPFEGTFVKDEEKTTGKGFFWEIQDPQKTQVVGFIDPGPKPDPVTQWLAYVNCPLAEGESPIIWPL
jgi:hypothetical protein